MGVPARFRDRSLSRPPMYQFVVSFTVLPERRDDFVKIAQKTGA
ncbi:MAG: hypothetical protein ACRDN0_05335 [Trebonia sp.]